jgi:hypothetical protein
VRYRFTCPAVLTGIAIDSLIGASGKQLMIGHFEEQARSGLNWLGNLAFLIQMVQSLKVCIGKLIIVCVTVEHDDYVNQALQGMSAKLEILAIRVSALCGCKL